MNTIETIKLDRVPKGKMPVLHASQYDNGRTHGIDLTNLGEEWKLDGTETLTINERKVDNNICSMDIENTFTGSSHIEFASFLQMCACAGSNFCELRISKGDVDIGTLNFILEVEPDPTADGIESESEIRNLKTQVEEITEEVIGDDYYTAEQTDDAIANATEGKADTTYVNEELAKKADKIDTYTKTQVDNALNNKMDKANPTGTGSLSINRKSNSVVGNNSVALGYNAVASASNSFAEGDNTVSSAQASHAEGYATEASARFAHAEGRGTVANSENAHAEGYNSTASGGNSHAEGNGTTASGGNSHAEGNGTTASGSVAHAEGRGTVANHRSQHVFGEHNIPDDSTATTTNKGNYVEIVGNGTSESNRSNARTLDWQGNETLAGDLTYNGNKSLTSEISRLDGRIDNLPAPMIFKGTLGVGGTIQSLPTASASNEGFTYKVITDGTYAGQTAKVGDVFISNGSAWVYIPSGDEDNDTWRAIKVNGVEKLGNGISSGSVDFRGSANIEVTFDADGNKIEVATKNIYTQSEVDTLIANAVDSVLPTDNVSGEVANFKTSLAKPLINIEVDNSATKIYQLGGNFFNKNTVTSGKMINGSGNEVSYANWNLSDYIPVIEGSKYYIYGLTVHPNTNQDNFELFDASKNKVGFANVKTNEQPYTIPSGVKYIKCCVKDPDIDTAQLGVAVNSGYSAYDPTINEFDIGDTITTIIGFNNIFADNGNVSVSFKCTVEDYVNAHSGGGGLRSLGNSNENLSKGGGGSEEDTDEGEDTEKVKELDEPKEEIKTIGDEPISKK